MASPQGLSAAIGLMGGSFNPPHQAHVALALAAQQQLGLSQVQLLLAPSPWQKASQYLAPVAHRAALLRLLLTPYPTLQLNLSECARPGHTYTINTLATFPTEQALVWIMGADQLHNFCTWHQWQAIAERVTLAVADRPGSALKAPDALQAYLDQLQRPLQIISMPSSTLSSTVLRQRIAALYADGRPWREQPQGRALIEQGAMPAIALDYLFNHQLYL